MGKYKVTIENKNKKTYYVQAENSIDAENKAYGIEIKNCQQVAEFKNIKILSVEKI